jgi:hypothetical protein
MEYSINGACSQVQLKEMDKNLKKKMNRNGVIFEESSRVTLKAYFFFNLPRLFLEQKQYILKVLFLIIIGDAHSQVFASIFLYFFFSTISKTRIIVVFLKNQEVNIIPQIESDTKYKIETIVRV